MIKTKSLALLSMAALCFSCSKKNVGNDSTPSPKGKTDIPTIDSSSYPPYTWQEHWFDHKQLLKRVNFNSNVAVYFDDDVNRAKAAWLFPFIDSVWAYTRKVYGDFGKDSATNRLFAVFHTNKYGGGHPDTYLNNAHDFRNTIDLGSGVDAWITRSAWETDATIHEVSHIVEGGSKGIKESPAFGIWGDSKWAEIFVYDVHKGMNSTTDMNRVYNTCMSTIDNYPRTNTAWFRNWFYPIYEQYGGAKLLNNYFELLSKNFPTTIDGVRKYSRAINLGEFVHFWSAAAGEDLSYRALMAFGPLDANKQNWIQQFNTAKQTFSAITYKPDSYYGKDLTQNATLSVNKENTGGASSSEGSLKLIDLDNNTKFYLSGYQKDFKAIQQFGTGVVANTYIITSGNDSQDRDPKTWTVEGSNDQSTWSALDSKTSQSFTYRNEIKQFSFSNSSTYKYYRLTIKDNAGSPDLQLSEWRLFQK